MVPNRPGKSGPKHYASCRVGVGKEVIFTVGLARDQGVGLALPERASQKQSLATPAARS